MPAAPLVPDHYRVLGVPVGANTAAIRDSYKKLSRVYHPDRNGGSARATSCFQSISVAHAELVDPDRRSHYDRLLALRDPVRMVDDPRAERALDVLDLVVRRLRRRPEALPGAARGRDLRVRQQIGFATAALGGQIAIEVAYTGICPDCAGQGSPDLARNPVCHVCHGKGTLTHGLRREPRSCGFCEGRGAVLLAACGRCAGDGTAAIRRSVPILVPPRTPSGAVLRARGLGETPTTGHQPGDLVVDLEVVPHALLSAAGDDLIVQVPIGWRTALYGGPIAVPTLEGVERLTLPADLGARRELRIAGRGLPDGKGGRGALRVQIAVDFPRGVPDGLAAELAHAEARLGSDAFGAVSAYQAAIDALTEGR